MARAGYLIALAVGIFVAFSVAVPSVNLGAALGALGVGSVILGFALKEVAQNFVSGILILFNKPFVIGDQIRSGDHEGTVEDIEFRATVLRTYDNRQVLIPNSELYTNRVEVNTAYDKRRYSVPITFPNDRDVEHVRDALLSTLTQVDGILSDPAPEALVTNLGDYSYEVTLRFWLSPSTRGEHTHKLNDILLAINSTLGDLQISNIRPESQVFLVEPRASVDEG